MTDSIATVESKKATETPSRKQPSLKRRLDRLTARVDRMAGFKHHSVVWSVEKKPISVETDKAGRVTLGKSLANKNFIVTYKENGTIELVPAVTVPLNQLWLFDNPEILAALDRGMAQSDAGEAVEYDYTADFT